MTSQLAVTALTSKLVGTAMGASFGMAGSKIQTEDQVTVLLAVYQRLPVTGRKQAAASGPGIFSPGSANQCMLGDMYLRSNLSRKQLQV